MIRAACALLAFGCLGAMGHWLTIPHYLTAAVFGGLSLLFFVIWMWETPA